MASPKLEVFFVKSTVNNLPLTGAAGAMAFETYKTDLGVNVTPLPTIIEIGGGLYGFLPVFSDADRGIAYVITTGANGNPDRIYRYMRPEDWNADGIPALQVDLTFLKKLGVGKAEIFTTGPNEDHMIIYDTDGTTVLQKWSLFDASGNPSPFNPFKKVPV